jgi:chlorophyllide a reductase subunit Y
MRAFFAGVGEGYAAGVWETTPKDRPDFREKHKKRLDALAKARKAEEMI